MKEKREVIKDNFEYLKKKVIELGEEKNRLLERIKELELELAAQSIMNLTRDVYKECEWFTHYHKL